MSLFLPLLLVLQWLHMLAGITWFGGYLFLDVVLWPTLLRLPVKQAKMTSDLIGKFAGPVMATSSTLVVLLGIIRGALLGPITSFSFLFGSSYGITRLVALAVSVILFIWGALAQSSHWPGLEGRWPEPWRHGSSAVGHSLRDDLFRPRVRLHGAGLCARWVRRWKRQ